MGSPKPDMYSRNGTLQLMDLALHILTVQIIISRQTSPFTRNGAHHLPSLSMLMVESDQWLISWEEGRLNLIPTHLRMPEKFSSIGALLLME